MISVWTCYVKWWSSCLLKDNSGMPYNITLFNNNLFSNECRMYFWKIKLGIEIEKTNNLDFFLLQTLIKYNMMSPKKDSKDIQTATCIISWLVWNSLIPINKLNYMNQWSYSDKVSNINGLFHKLYLSNFLTYNPFKWPNKSNYCDKKASKAINP